MTLIGDHSDSYRLGGFKIKGVTKGTVGLGSIEVAKGEIPGDLNRDLNATQTRETIYKVKEFEFSSDPLKPLEELKEELGKLSDKTPQEIIRQFGSSLIDAATEAVSWLKEMFQSKEEVFENGVFEDVEPEEEEPEDDEEIDEDQSEEEAKPEDDNEEVNSEDKDKKKKKAEERKSKASKEDSNIANEQSQSESKAEQGNEDEREATRDGNDQSRANHDETSYIPDAYQQTETTDNKVGKPLVEIFARHVDGTFGTLEHSYTIFTDSKGHRTIITGFPEKNSIVGMLFYNLKVVDCPYTEENKRLFGDDWESKEVKRWSVDKFNLENDAELQDHLLKARTAVKFIETGNNGGRFDYDLCITDNCSGGNSNTVQKVIWNAMGREIKVQKGIDLPGINGKFYDGPLDDPMRKFGEEIQKEQP